MGPRVLTVKKELKWRLLPRLLFFWGSRDLRGVASVPPGVKKTYGVTKGA